MRERTAVPNGTRYGRLTVIAEVPKVGCKRRFLCRCDCGTLKTIRLSFLRSGNTRSCGCLASEMARRRLRTHGLSLDESGKRLRLYRIWAGMKTRCANPGRGTFDSYGGRGIAVCPEWAAFEPFHDWAMANGYRADLTIDRIDNDGGYRPDNCRWVTWQKQRLNTRRNRLVAFNGETKTVKEWADELGFAYHVLRGRLVRGWPMERAFTAPVRGRPVAQSGARLDG